MIPRPQSPSVLGVRVAAGPEGDELVAPGVSDIARQYVSPTVSCEQLVIEGLYLRISATVTPSRAAMLAQVSPLSAVVLRVHTARCSRELPRADVNHPTIPNARTARDSIGEPMSMAQSRGDGITPHSHLGRPGGLAKGEATA